MIPRFFTFIAILAIAVVFISVAAEEPEIQIDEDQSLGDVEPRNPALAIAVRILMQAFKWAAKHCLKEAAHHCKQHWKNSKALVNCGRGYLQANKGRCVIG